MTADTPSAAERRLHGLLRDVDLPGWSAVHSLNLAKIDQQRWGEIDFVLIASH